MPFLNICCIKTLHPQKNIYFGERESNNKLLSLSDKIKCKGFVTVFKEKVVSYHISPSKAQMD